MLPMLACSMPGEPLALARASGDPLPPGRQGHPIEGMYADPASCVECHPRQYEEWQGSMMRYGMHSPTFNAFEALANQFHEAGFEPGTFRKGGAMENFCARCHSPIGAETDQFSGLKADGTVDPVRDGLGPAAAEGVSCVVCHQTQGPDLAGSLLGDGIANTAIVLDPSLVRRGPIADPVPSLSHRSEYSEYLRSPDFCGSCHDVRPEVPDAKTGEPFSRLENAFTEWRESPYATTANPYGQVITCQDCHMSLFPYSPPGTYPVGKVAEQPGVEPMPTRRVSTHYFTGVDVALVPYPGQDDPSLDQWGMPRGQKQRRRDLLRAACTLTLEGTPQNMSAGAPILPIRVTVTNVGAGHRVPTGFSQEREVWIELIVRDGDGRVVYETGTLVDSAHPETGEHTPDGRLEDEDLRELIGRLDPVTFEVVGEAPGPDARDEARNLGLVTFTNHFERNGHRVDVPMLADHFNNDRSLPPLVPVVVPYDVPLPGGVDGPFTVSARLRFRHFPPRFLRMLAEGRPDLVSERIVDRLEIIDMAEAEQVVQVGG